MSKEDPLHHDPIDVLGEAYEKLLERALDDGSKIRHQSLPAMRKFIDSARDKAVELEELTREEADKVADYLRRDLHDAGAYLTNTKDELKGWLGFESSFMETALFERFLTAADKTVVDLHELQHVASIYHAGQVTGPGTLVCDGCGKELHFHKPKRIPPCATCSSTFYRRPER